MTKRVVAGVLWAFCLWYAWSLYAGLAGWNPLWGPVIVLSIAVLALGVRIRHDWALDASRQPVSTGAGSAPAIDPA